MVYNRQKYFIYLDILGFKGWPEEIEEKRGVKASAIRKSSIDVIEKRIKTINQEGRIIGAEGIGGDSWLLVAESLDKAFESIHKILEHHTPYKGYEKIPLEIAVGGPEEFNRWAKFDGKELTCEDSTIKFLKVDIISYYHKWYKEKNNRSPKSTFILFTESAYNEIEPLDKKMCQKVRYKQNKKEIKFFAADVGKVQQRGRVFEFLEKIGYVGSKRYDRINEVYVPPLEYEDIKKTLEEKRVVFITGTPEYGKTYTAVRLMWEYYNRGYKPRWIRGEEERERVEVREKLEDIRAGLKPKHIIHFEDPFGKIRYESRDGLEREIGTIISSIQQAKDTYVLITSREEVFKEFEKEKLSAVVLKEFENKMTIKKPSYDGKKRREILLKWAKKEGCKWLRKKELKNLVLEKMKDEEILPSPLSVHDFVMATINIEKEDELYKKINEKSEETEKNFAREIKNMTYDKILFLSFLFISEYFEIEFVRKVYQELVKELDLKDAWEFNRILDWFKDDKVEISYRYLRLSHPSYSESLK